MALEPGLSASIVFEVGAQDTAIALGSGDVAVLATPRVVAMVEAATCAAVAPELQPGQTTVGVRVQVEHIAPTLVGVKVTAEAVVEKVAGKRITFNVTAKDHRGLILAGKVTRVLVDRERFMEKCE